MNKLYTKFLALIVFAFAIGGCKVDAPVYPAGTISTIGKDKGNTGTGTGSGTGTGTGSGTGTGTGTGTGAGTGENTGDGLPIGATNTIQLQLTANGPIKTIKNNLSAISFFGIMSINGIESQSSIIQIGYMGDGAGTFDLSILGTESLSLDQTSPAKIKITQYNYNTTTNKGTIKGTFSADLTDGNGTTYKHAIGSFNISQ